MSKFNCKHDWEIVKEYHIGRNGEESSVVHCQKCGVDITINEAMQIELWKHTTGILKRLSIGGFVISIVALIISLFK